MNSYELIMIFDPVHGEERIGQITARVEEKIRGLGGEIEKSDRWGTRRLNSMMKKAKRLTQGYYTFIRFKAPPTVPAEVGSYLKVNEHVIRYFLSRAVAAEAVGVEKKEIAGAPLEAVPVGEIKGEPLGEPK